MINNYTVIQISIITFVVNFFVLLYGGLDSLSIIPILFFTILIGNILVKTIIGKNEAYKSNRLMYFWNIKITLSIIIFNISWLPFLNPFENQNWGFDAQRFYWDSIALIENNWQITVDSNYQGIIYYYGIVMKIFGENPIIPLLFNSIVTLCAAIILIKYLSECCQKVNLKNFNYLACIILIPEMLWYDVMTSRENIIGSILVFLLPVSYNIFFEKYAKNFINYLSLILLLTLVIMIRTTIILPIALTFIYLLFKSKKISLNIKFLTLILIAIILFLAPKIQILIGGVGFEYDHILLGLIDYKNNIASNMEGNWTENSIGRLITPDSILSALFFIPLRMILYIIAPIPNIEIILFDMNGFMFGITSLAMIFLFPYVIAGSINSFNGYASNREKLIYAFFWTIFISIAGGNMIIHERYRVMQDMLFFGCSWLGYMNCKPRNLQTYFFIWYLVLFSGAIFYFSYKNII